MSTSFIQKIKGPASLRKAETPGHCSIPYLTGVCQLRHELGGVHDLHELAPKLPGPGRFLRSERPDRLKVEQRIGLALLAGGLLQGDLRDHAADRCQGAQKPGGVFQEPGLAGDRDTHQKGDNAARPQQEQQHRFLAGFGIALAVLGTEVVVGTVGAGFPIFGDDAVLAHTDRRRPFHRVRV